MNKNNFNRIYRRLLSERAEFLANNDKEAIDIEDITLLDVSERIIRVLDLSDCLVEYFEKNIYMWNNTNIVNSGDLSTDNITMIAENLEKQVASLLAEQALNTALELLLEKASIEEIRSTLADIEKKKSEEVNFLSDDLGDLGEHPF